MLVEWCSVFLLVIAERPELWQEWGLKVVQPQAQLLEQCCGPSQREGRIHSALVATRRGVRAIAKNEKLKETAVKEMIATLTAKGPASTAANAPLLGVIAGVCDRLASMRGLLQEQASAYCTFYTREIIGSRTIVPTHIANGLHDFFASSVVTQSTVEQELVPAIEKALLRSPEVVLNDLLTPLIEALSTDIDLSKTLKDRLLKSLVANIKSTNPAIRDGAVKGFRAIASRTSDENIIPAIAIELLKNLKDTKAADQRVLAAQLLSALRPCDASIAKVLPDIVAIASKEPNESALNAELDTMTTHVVFALQHDKSLDANISKAISTGFGDKKPSVRRIWAVHYGEIAWWLQTDELTKPNSAQFMESIAVKLIPSWEEVLSNPVTAAQNGLVTVANVLCAIHLTKFRHVESIKGAATLQKANISAAALGSDAKPSFLVNHRVYNKLVSPDDFLWAIRALGAASSEFSNKSVPATFGISWAQAFTFMITSTSIPPQIRQEASRTLQQCWLAKPSQVSAYVVDGMWQWLNSVDLEEKDSPATSGKTDNERLHLVLSSLCSASPTSAKDAQLSNGDTPRIQTHLSQLMKQLVVLCRKPLLSRVQWIDLCLQCGLDPRTIVMESPQSFMDEVTKRALVCLMLRLNIVCKLLIDVSTAQGRCSSRQSSCSCLQCGS